MTRTIEGLAFYVHSPSMLELVNFHNDTEREARVFVVFESRQLWQIVYQDVATGHTVTRAFKSRDEAIQLIASRRAA
jgi:hypothetical protein